MQLADVTRGMERAAERFDRWFPMPKILAPRSIGVDISDASVKWIGLEAAHHGGYEIVTHGSEPLAPGIVTNGVILDQNKLAEALHLLRERTGTALVHAALPEEPAYVFGMHIPPGTPRAQAMRLVEFEFNARVPIPASAAVYDYDVIGADDKGLEIGVCVFPHEVAESYAAAFRAAGLELLSLEIEARSAARAVSARLPAEHVELLIDFGGTRTGFAVLKNGIPIFTSTVDLGGGHMTELLMQKLSLSAEEAERLKNDEGLFAKTDTQAREELLAQAAMLADEVARHFHFWDTRRDEAGKRMTPVGKVILVGGGANLKGLADFIAGKVQAPAERGNVWRNVLSFNDAIPPIDRRTSLRFATAVGLALRGV